MKKNENNFLFHEWSQIIVVLITVFGLFLWVRTESRNDHRDLKTSIEANLAAIQKDAREFREMWAQETKEFHGRLIAIEERAKLGDKQS